MVEEDGALVLGDDMVVIVGIFLLASLFATFVMIAGSLSFITSALIFFLRSSVVANSG